MSMLKTTILALNLDAAPIGWNGSQRMLPKKGKVKEIADVGHLKSSRGVKYVYF